MLGEPLDFFHAFIAASAYGGISALSVIPIVTLIAMLVGTRSTAAGFSFSIGYALGYLTALFLLMFGFAQLFALDLFSLDEFRPSGYVDVAIGVILIVGAVWWKSWRANNPKPAKQKKLQRSGTDGKTQALGSLGTFLLGFQFPFHPGCLIFVIAAAGHTTELNTIERLGIAIWFVLLAVSTSVALTLFFAFASNRAQARLRLTRMRIAAAAPRVGYVLVIVAGALIILYGLWHIFMR